MESLPPPVEWREEFNFCENGDGCPHCRAETQTGVGAEPNSGAGAVRGAAAAAVPPRGSGSRGRVARSKFLLAVFLALSLTMAVRAVELRGCGGDCACCR